MMLNSLKKSECSDEADRGDRDQHASILILPEIASSLYSPLSKSILKDFLCWPLCAVV